MYEVARIHKNQAHPSRSRALTRADYMALLEVSAITFHRGLNKSRDQYGIPIYNKRYGKEYVLKKTSRAYWDLGIWLNKNLLFALVTIQELVEQLIPTLPGPHLMPLEEKLSEMLKKQQGSTSKMSRQVNFLQAAERSVSASMFEIVAQVFFSRKLLRFNHLSKNWGALQPGSLAQGPHACINRQISEKCSSECH